VAGVAPGRGAAALMARARAPPTAAGLVGRYPFRTGDVALKLARPDRRPLRHLYVLHDRPGAAWPYRAALHRSRLRRPTVDHRRGVGRRPADRVGRSSTRYG